MNLDSGGTGLGHSAAHWAASDCSVNDLTGINLNGGSSRRAGGGDLGWRGRW